MRSTGLGIVLTEGPTPHDWSAAASGFRDLEELGCSAVWLTDHLFWHRPMPEALTMAAVAATATTGCTIGTGVLQLPLRRTAAVARAATTIQGLSGGRLVLGVGVGEHAREYELTGAPFSRRGRDLDDGMDHLRRLWSPDVDPDDRFLQLPAPDPIPLWVGGRSPAAIERVASRADGWMPMFLGAARYREACGELDEALARRGRPAAEVVRAVTVLAAVTTGSADRARALAWCSDLWRIDPTRLERHVVTGTAAQVAEAVETYRAAGAEHVSVLLASDRPLEAFAALR